MALGDLTLVPNNLDTGATPELRRFVQIVAEYLNSWIRNGQVIRPTLGNATITINLQASSGLEIDANGSIRIDLATTVLTLTAAGLTFANQTGNKVLASPEDGSNGPPDFHPLANLAVTSLNGNRGSLQIANGAGLILTQNSTTLTLAAGGTGVVLSVGNATTNTTGAVRLLSATGNVTVVANAANNSISFDASSSSEDPKTAWYPSFAVTGNNDEFDDGAFTGWTAVANGSGPTITLTETNNVLSILHPGGDPNSHLHAWVKPFTFGIGNYVEVAFSGFGRAQNFNVFGLIAANGTTWGSGNQGVYYYSPAESAFGIHTHSGYNSFVSPNMYGAQETAPAGTYFMRLYKSAANQYYGQSSPDGISWSNITALQSVTVDANFAGFFVSSWGGTEQFVWTVRYFKFG